MQVITTKAELAHVLEQLPRHPELAIDIEADGLFRYRARLCTIQLAADGNTYVCDTLALGDDVRLLEPLLGEKGPRKIFHDLSLDARMLFAAGMRIERVFDTQLAARFLGAPATGLGSLLEARFGIVLDKQHQQADWGKRPFEDALLRYLNDDVAHLPALAEQLRAELVARDIVAEVEEETRYVLAQALEPVAVLPAWLKLSGVDQLPPRVRGALSELCRTREILAEELDLPAGRVLAGQAMLRMAQSESDKVERLLPKALSEHAPRFVEALLRGTALGEAPEHELRHLEREPLSPREIEARRRRRKLLTELRAREAKARGVDPQVVLPGHCLSELTALSRLSPEALHGVRGFGETRMARYAARWLAELGSSWPTT